MDALDLDGLFSGIRTSIEFRHRPSPIPGDLRLTWRITMALLVLSRCRANTASVEQLQVLVWACRSAQGRSVVERWFREQYKSPEELAVRYDPTLVRTVAIAIASDLVKRNPNGTLTLTSEGLRITRAAMESGTLGAEQEFLNVLPRRVTQRSIRDLLEIG